MSSSSRLASGELSNEPETAAATVSAKTSTFAALHHTAFRWFFFGQLVSLSGTWMQNVAQQIVVYQMTNSQLALGLVACAQGLPSLLIGPFAGVLIERFPRRQILVMTQTVMMLLAFLLAVLYATNSLEIWHLMLLSLGVGTATAIDAPARLSFLVEMVGKDDLPSSVVLNSMMFNLSRIIGPAIGGLALTGLGAAWCFLLNALSFLAVLFGLAMMRVPPSKVKKGQLNVLRPLLEGIHFARHHPTIRPLLLLSALTSSFGLTFTVLIPPFADKVLGNTEVGTSALLTAQGIGALVATIYIGRTTNSGHRGKTLLHGALLAPVMLMMLAFTQNLTLACIIVMIAGFAFVCQFVLTNTLLQLVVPDEFRGRILSLYTITFFGLTPFGSLIMGATAQVVNTVPSIVMFALICLGGTWLIRRSAPEVRQLP
ncbi:MAG: MFS transporter [Anaerolineae bacterium]